MHKTFNRFLVFYFLMWWWLPALLAYSPPHDIFEGLIWGAHFELGYYKHPPLQAWILGGLVKIFGYHAWVIYFPSAVCITLALYGVWKTALRLVDEQRAFIATLLLVALPFYHFSAPEFNPNILQLPFWAWAGWAFVHALLDRKLHYWLWLGIFIGISFYAKYSTLILVITLLGCLLVLERNALRSKGPYLCALVALAIFTPQMVWLHAHDYLPLHYASGRARLGESYDLMQSFMRAGHFVLSQTLIASVFILSMLIISWRGARTTFGREQGLITVLALGPLLLMLLFTLVTGGKVKDMWTAPMWNFIGLWCVMMWKPVSIRRAGAVFIVVNVLAIAVYAGSMRLGPDVTGKIRREHFDGAGFAHAVQEKVGHPIHTIIADTWLGGTLLYYLDSHPDVMIDGNPIFSPWVKDTKGAILVWKDALPEEIKTRFPHAREIGTLEGKWVLKAGYTAFPVHVYQLP